MWLQIISALQPLLKIPILKGLAQLFPVQSEFCVDMLGVTPNGLIGDPQPVSYFIAPVSEAGESRDLLLALRETLPQAGIFILISQDLDARFDDIAVNFLFVAPLPNRQLFQAHYQVLILEKDAYILPLSSFHKNLPEERR